MKVYLAVKGKDNENSEIKMKSFKENVMALINENLK